MEVSKIIRVEELKGLFPAPENYEAIKTDISQRGIKEPLVITSDGRLICGYTRLQIAEEMEVKEVPVRIEPLNDISDIQEYAIRDNYHRRQLSKLQMVELCGKKLEEIEAKKAEERMKSGKADPMSTMNRGLTRDIVGKQLGMSGTTYQRWKTVSEHASPSTKDFLEEGKINLHAALELCKLDPTEQDKLIKRIKKPDSPYITNFKTLKEKVWKYGQKDIDEFYWKESKVQEESGLWEDAITQVTGRILIKWPDADIQELEKEIDEATLCKDKPFTRNLAIATLKDQHLKASDALTFARHLMVQIYKDKALYSYELFKLVAAVIGCLDKSLCDEEREFLRMCCQDKTLCTTCSYVGLYEIYEGIFADSRDVRKVMYPYAAQIVAYIRPDWFIDGSVDPEACFSVHGFRARDWAELFYLDAKKWKEENNHDCFEEKNMSVVHDPDPKCVQPPGIKGAEMLLEDYEAGRPIKNAGML